MSLLALFLHRDCIARAIRLPMAYPISAISFSKLAFRPQVKPMRLELEPTFSPVPFAEAADQPVQDNAAEAAEHLRQGIRAAQAGNRPGARTALLRAAELDPRSESAWLWLSSISEYPEELLVFLTNVLDINPHNARALEWSAATRSLLAKNLVQRGIDAAETGQHDLAVQHFNQALEHDEKNPMAWLWLASLSESNEGKLSYLEKVLEFDPENETARAGYQTARNSIRENLLSEARTAAVAGKGDEANELLDAIIAEEPNAEDAWILRAHIAAGFEDKVAAFRRVVEINPENLVAKAGLDSLTAIMDAVGAAAAKAEAPVEEFVEPMAADHRSDAAPAEVETEVAAEPTAAEDLSVQEENVWEAAEPVENWAETDQTGDDAIETSPFDSFAEESFVPDTDPDEAAADEAVFAEQAGPDEPEAVSEVEEIAYELAEEEVQVSEELDDQPVAFAGEPFPVVEPGVDADHDLAPPIAAPGSNPFNSEAFSAEDNGLKTMLSIELDEETRAALANYKLAPEPVEESGPEPTTASAFDVPFDATMYASNIPMPVGDLDNVTPFPAAGFETRLVAPAFVDGTSVSHLVKCSFCDTDNDVQAIACQGCLAVLTLADLELILANHHADKAVLRQAVERMESEKAARELSEAELTTLGIGHLNLRNLQFGFNCLQEAAQKNPDNVVLSGQVNALLIRLEEIKEQEAAHQSMTKGKTILVVDDSPTVRKLIAGKLEKCGHEVFCSADGVEAMEQLESLKPDLVLLDITMPRMDGYQVCKLIRSNDVTKDVPVVMISGKDGFFDKVRGRMAGTSGYITKPFGPETLMKAVESYLRGEA